MNEDEQTQERLEALEERLRAVEASAQDAQDRLEVQNLVAASAFLLDAAEFGKRAAQFEPGGVFELIPKETFPTEPDWPPTTAEDVEAITVGEESDEFIGQLRTAHTRGLSHFPSIVHVAVRGDRAVAIQHIAVLERDATAEPLEVPPHGIIRGFRTLEVNVNHFECHRTPDGWRIARRSLRVNTGEEARRLLRDWAAEV